MKKIAWIVAAFAVAGCSEGTDRPVPPETLNEQRAAFRQACVAQELALRAEEDVATIESVLQSTDPSNPLAEINRMASAAALEFARAYSAHAQIREVAYAYLDSAVNHARATADSARYLERATAVTVRVPQTGTVEENVITSYSANFAATLGDPDHRCNWDLPF